MQQLGQFAEVFGGEDGEGVAETVVAEGCYVFFHFMNNSFEAAGAGSAEPHAGNYFGQVAEVHFGVGHYAEHKIVVAGNVEGGVEMTVLFIYFLAEEQFLLSFF